MHECKIGAGEGKQFGYPLQDGKGSGMLDIPLVDARKDIHHSLAMEWRMYGEDRVKNSTQSKHIGTGIDIRNTTRGLLGRHILRRAHHGPFSGQRTE